jgi:hypothetical protein
VTSSDRKAVVITLVAAFVFIALVYKPVLDFERWLVGMYWPLIALIVIASGASLFWWRRTKSSRR